MPSAVFLPLPSMTKAKSCASRVSLVQPQTIGVLYEIINHQMEKALFP